MKFTPLLAALSLAAGILLAYNVNIAFLIACISLFAIVFAIRSAYLKTIDFTVAILTLIFTAGIFLYGISSGNTFHKTRNYINRYVTVTGKIITAAKENDYDENFRYTLYVRSIEQGGNTSDIKDRISLSTPEHLKCGDIITVSGIMKDFTHTQNTNGFSSALYYKSQNIAARMFSKNISYSDEKINFFSPSILGEKMREKADDIIYRIFNGDSAAMLSAVLTGNKTHFSKELSRACNSTSFNHLIHPAYLHVMILSTLLGFLSAFVNNRICNVLLILFLVIIALFGSSHIGFVRCSLGSAALIFFREKSGYAYYPDVMSLIFITAVLINPMIIFNSAFVTSMLAGLIVWAFSRYVLKAHFMLFIPEILRRTIAAVIVCTLIYTPLMTVWFSSICIYSFILPFIVIPLVSVILVTAPPVIALIMFFGKAPILGGYFMTSLQILLKLPYIIEKLPFSTIVIGTPSLVETIVIIFCIFSLYCFLRKEYKILKPLLFTASALSLSVVITAISRIGTTDIYFINVGQGDASAIHTAFGGTVITDGGGGNAYSDYNPGESIFVPYLKSKSFGTIDAAIVSHFHKDHIQGIIAAIEELNVKHVFAPPSRENQSTEESYWESALEKAASENDTEIHRISENTKLKFNCGLEIYMYALPHSLQSDNDENDRSLLTKIKFGETSFLYTGDMTSYAENEYISNNTNISADVLKIAHHGSKNSTCQAWVDRVNPQYSVISCDENNIYGHPGDRVLDVLSNTSVLRTDTMGDIHFTVNKKKIKYISTFK